MHGSRLQRADPDMRRGRDPKICALVDSMDSVIRLQSLINPIIFPDMILYDPPHNPLILNIAAGLFYHCMEDPDGCPGLK